MERRNIEAFVRALRLHFGERARVVAELQRDTATGEPRRTWAAIVAALS